jgi:hypothetical protein
VLLKATGLVVQQISRGIHMWACVENPADSIPEHRIAGCKIKKKNWQTGWMVAEECSFQCIGLIQGSASEGYD